MPLKDALKGRRCPARMGIMRLGYQVPNKSGKGRGGPKSSSARVRPQSITRNFVRDTLI